MHTPIINDLKNSFLTSEILYIYPTPKVGMKIAITGAFGNIGASTLKHLLEINPNTQTNF